MPRRWQLQEAKARFSEVVEDALAGTAQVVTRRGEPAVVVIAYDEYTRLNGYDGSAWTLFQGAPHLDEQDLPIQRDPTRVRPVDLA